MANTRDFKSLGIIASDAIEVTEDGVREQGTAYRRTNLSDIQQIEGEPYDDPPITENINQKLFNQSSFTDIIDGTGILGWTNLVDYAPPSVVWANDGTPNTGGFYLCLRASGPSTSVFDPISDDQNDPVFWRVYENPEQLRLDLADETPGSEGSRLVGYNNFDTNGGVDDGLTVKEALDILTRRINRIDKISILASLNCQIQTDPGDPPFINEILILGSFNVDTSNLEVVPQNLVGLRICQGIKVPYLNVLPANYLVLNGPFVFGQLDFETGNTNSTNSRTTASYFNKNTTDIEIIGQSINQVPGSGTNNPIFRFNFICYEILP